MLAKELDPFSAAVPGPTGRRVCTRATPCPACLGMTDFPGGRSLANQVWPVTPISRASPVSWPHCPAIDSPRPERGLLNSTANDGQQKYKAVLGGSQWTGSDSSDPRLRQGPVFPSLFPYLPD